MKKVVGKSLVLGAIALGVLSLLGGPNVFSVLSNIKFPSKSQTEKPVEKKEEKPEIEVKEEPKSEGVGDELALEAAPQVKRAEKERIEEAVVKPEKPLEKIEPKPEPEKQSKAQEKTTSVKPIEKPVASSSSGYSRRDLGDGIVEITHPNGEAIRYKGNKRIWSSRKGRLTETAEEKAWRRGYVSINKPGASGSKGKGVWCLTPRYIENVDEVNQCSSFRGWNSH